MRSVLPLLLAVCLCACGTERATAPREYLDERTAATITVVKHPWIFTRGSVRQGTSQHREFLHLYAIDVNRMGQHEQYIAALQSHGTDDTVGASIPPTLELESGDWLVSFRASTVEPKALGIAQPVAEAYALDAKWWYFPVDKQVLATIVNSANLEAALVWPSERAVYTLWRDGREALFELTAVLP